MSSKLYNFDKAKSFIHLIVSKKFFNVIKVCLTY